MFKGSNQAITNNIDGSSDMAAEGRYWRII